MSVTGLTSTFTTADIAALLEEGSHEHTDGVKPPARVYVDGTEIPVVNDGVRTEIRKDGAMGITHFSEVYFPAEWNGTDYANVVDALDPDARNVYDPVDVQYRDYVRDEYLTVHRGFVMGVGGGGRGDLERRMTVGDIGQLLGGMPISASYDAETPYTTLVKDVITRMEDGGVIPAVVEDVELAVGNLAEQDNTVDVIDPFPNTIAETAQTVTSGPLAAIVASGNILGSAIDSFIKNNITQDTEFTPNQDTAADVLDWVASRSRDSDRDTVFPQGIFYFEPADNDPTSSRVRLVFDIQPYAQFDAIHTKGDTSADRYPRASGEVKVLQNNALHEIRPVNQFTVNGAISDQSRAQLRNVRGYPTATAVHERLADRANVPLEPPHYHAEEATSVDEVKSIAVDKLEAELNEASLGTITMAPAPRIRPHTYVRSRPACGTDRETGVEPLNYEVESMVHTARAQTDDGERAHATTVRCSVPTTDIIVDSEVILVDEDNAFTPGDLPAVGSP